MQMPFLLYKLDYTTSIFAWLALSSKLYIMAILLFAYWFSHLWSTVDSLV